MVAIFSGNPATTIIVAYAPTEDKPETTKKKLYDELLQTTLQVPTHNLLIIAGDFNARIGLDSHTTNPRAIGKHLLHPTTNDNGNRLVEFCETTNMRPTQSRFPHRKSRIWTWQHPSYRTKSNEHQTQLDHILVNGKWIKSVHNVRAYDAVELGSDHRIVSANIKLRLRAEVENKCKRVKFDWPKLIDSKDLQNEFEIEIKNRFNLLTAGQDTDLQPAYDEFEKSSRRSIP